MWKQASVVNGFQIYSEQLKNKGYDLTANASLEVFEVRKNGALLIQLETLTHVDAFYVGLVQGGNK